MGRVTSTQFFAGSVVPGYQTLATVPAGERWLIRDVRLEVGGVSSYAGVGINVGGIDCTIWSLFPPPDYGMMVADDAFVIANEGDSLWIICSDVPGNAIITGHVLTLP